jgi:DNA repair protein RecO (recombination protein O)
MTRVNDEPCIVLHTRPFRESSLIVSGLSLDHGRIALMARGVRKNRRGRLLQPLNCLRISYAGRSAMQNLNSFEVQLQPTLHGVALASGLYLAELTTRLVAERESHPKLFAGLYWALENLSSDVEAVLRQFEKLLLDELGYGLDFVHDAQTALPVSAQQNYQFDPSIGFVASNSERGYPGEVLQAIDRGDYSTPRNRALAKRIFRQALSEHLGSKPLLSRKLLYSPGNR